MRQQYNVLKERHPAPYSILAAFPLILLYEMGQWFLSTATRGPDNRIDVEMLDLLVPKLFSVSPMVGNLCTELVIILFAVWALFKLRDTLQSQRLAQIILEGLLLSVVVWLSHIVTLQALEFWIEFEIHGRTWDLGVGSLFIGAGSGYYEEFLYRVVLLSGSFWLFRKTYLPKSIALLLAILISTLYFVGAHSDGVVTGDTTLQDISRASLSVVFSIIYLTRGFAVAAWSHAMYDVMVMW